MQILGRFCLLIVVCFVLELYKKFFQIIFAFFIMDCASFLKSLTQGNEFGFGFVLFGCFSQVFNILGLFLMLCFGLKVLQLNWHPKEMMQFLRNIRGKPSNLSNGIYSKNDFGKLYDDAQIKSCKCNKSLSFLEDSKLSNVGRLVNQNSENKAKDVLEEDSEVEFGNEDEVFDVMSLRNMVKYERQRANVACAELEKERMAAASAADEAMTMILRLQSEKSVIEIEVNQYRRLAEQKQEYDQEVIQSLQWIVHKYESERSVLEDHLGVCSEKLKLYMKIDDFDRLERIESSLNLFSSAMIDSPETG